MTLMTAKQAGKLQAAALVALTQSCTITHRTISKDSYGGGTPTESTATASCRWIPLTVEEKMQAGATPETALGRILLPHGTTIAAKDKILIGTDNYEVSGIESSIDSALVIVLATRV